MDLKATQSTGASAQPLTSSPQSSNPSNGIPLTSRVQPTNQGSTLNTSSSNAPSSGIALSPKTLPTVALQGTATGTTAPPPAPHHINPILITASILLFVVAVGLLMLTGRSEKNTTY